MLLIEHWFRAFLWTLGIELVVAAYTLRNQLPLARRVGLILIANVATHPAVWLIFPELGMGFGFSRWVTLTLSEVWAFGFETFVYALFLGRGKLGPAATAAIAANTASLGLGYALRAIGFV